MMFVYSAIDRRGERLSETLEAATLREAQHELLGRGLLVLSVEPARRKSSAGVPRPRWLPWWRANGPASPGARMGELTLFARQMSMMLRAGASVVPALQAINEQPGRPAWHALLADLAERVEGGATLHDAMGHHPGAFSGMLRSIVSAGEASGTLGDAFQRLSALMEGRLRTRKRVISALIYPCMLLFMATSVVISMTTFVLPRFAQLFKSLDTPLPALTRFMLATSEQLKTWWPAAVGVPILAITAIVLWVRSPGGRQTIGRVALRIPLLGRAVSGVLLAQLLQMWAALLRSRVPLLEAIAEAKDATGNIVYQRLIAQI